MSRSTRVRRESCRQGAAPPLIATLEQRLDGFADLGIEAALVLKFDADLALVTADEFLRGILVEKLGMGAILVGPHFRFGHRQAGDVRMLEDGANRFGYTVELMPPVRLGDGMYRARRFGRRWRRGACRKQRGY